jgi:hypothetical protein
MIYLIVKKNYLKLLRKVGEYYSTVIVNDNYLLFDTIKENNIIIFNAVNISNENFVENRELPELLNTKVEYNYPKILLFSNSNKLISLYDENQLSIANYKHNKVEKNNKKISKKLEINCHSKLNPKIIKYSNIYSESYHPSHLFDDSSKYYCSGIDSNKNNNYIEIDLCCDYFLEELTLVFHDSYLDCIPKNCSLKIFDNKKNQIVEFKFSNKEEEKKVIEINEITRYILFEFNDNFGGKYIVIKKFQFKGKILSDINYAK